MTDPQPENAESKYAPKRKGRWILEVEGFDAFLVHSCSRPKVTVNENKKFYESMEFGVSDAINPSGAKQVQSWLDKCDETRKAKLKLLDVTGNVIESWDFPELKLEYVDFGELTYQESTPLSIHVIVRPTEKGYEYWSV